VVHQLVFSIRVFFHFYGFCVACVLHKTGRPSLKVVLPYRKLAITNISWWTLWNVSPSSSGSETTDVHIAVFQIVYSEMCVCLHAWNSGKNTPPFLYECNDLIRLHYTFRHTLMTKLRVPGYCCCFSGGGVRDERWIALDTPCWSLYTSSIHIAKQVFLCPAENWRWV
jgi:hypothetical protein